MDEGLFPEFSQSEFANVLFHYTTADGLAGIASSSTVWATDAEFLNDAQELEFGRAQMVDAMLSAADELSPESEAVARDDWDDCRKAAGCSAGFIRSAVAEISKRACDGAVDARPFWAVYVACFCEQGDLLSQWRGYAAAGGFALGFDKSALAGALVDVDQRPLARLTQVTYGRGAVEPVVRSVISAIDTEPRGLPDAFGCLEAANTILPALAGLKHDAFREECEWRLIVMGERSGEPVRFRPGQISPTPYLELTLARDALKVVVVGPGAHQQLRCDAVARLLRSAYGVDIPVRRSSAPFRG